jgi:ABC-type phosphate/phosphonate transport system substrate-binding protein
MPNATLRLSYYPWITQHTLPSVLHGHIEAFARILETELARATGQGATIEVLAPVSVPRQIEMISWRQAEIALMNPLGYAFARKRESAVEAVAVALRAIDGTEGDTYFAQLYTRRRTAIAHGLSCDTAPADWPALAARLRGRTLGFGSPQSTSNFLIPAHLLWKQGVHPLTAFSSVRFIGGHDTVAKAVYAGEVDIGAGHDGVILDLARQYGYGDAQDRLVRFARVHITSDPVVARLDDPAQTQALRSALAATGLSAAGRIALGSFWGGVTGLGPVANEAYDALLDAVTDLGLRESDLMA